MARYADIVINRKIKAADRIFTYAVPAEWTEQIVPGILVRVPFNREVLEGVVVAVADHPPAGMHPDKIRPIREVIGDRPLFSGELLTLSAWMGDYYLCPRVVALQAMLPAGLHFSGKPPRAFYTEYYRIVSSLPELRMTAKRRQLLTQLAATGESDVAQLEQAGFSRSFLGACCKSGLLIKEKRRIAESGNFWTATASPLSPEQQTVYEQICGCWREDNRPFLLHGITGSGKTEIYLKLIDKIVALGKQAIVLVPEIALSGQMLTMLQERLSLRMAVLHSGLAPGKRRIIWQDIAGGKIDIVVGPRSAIFAPLPALGLIIVDEEHESSYKQEHQPRFHAVTVARKRAELTGAHLVLGSATPAVESYYLAQNGIYAWGKLQQHYYPAPPPVVDIVDMRRELRCGNTNIFSRALVSALTDTLAAGAQSVLFLNRR
ncbi:MAG: primosomal protein N', partial [Clostridiales bacterium]